MGQRISSTVCILLLLIGASKAIAQRNYEDTPRAIFRAQEPADTSTTSIPDVDFWIGLDLGYGGASPICSACGENGPQSGTTGNVYLGFGLNRNVLLGVQASLWVIDAGLYNSRNDHIYKNHFMLVSYYYPRSRSGFFGKLGVGLSSYSAYDRYRPALKDTFGKDLPSLVHSQGFGAMIGVGNDFSVGSKLFLSLSLTYFYGNLGSLFLDETNDLQVRKALNLLELNVGFMFRPRDS